MDAGIGAPGAGELHLTAQKCLQRAPELTCHGAHARLRLLCEPAVLPACIGEPEHDGRLRGTRLLELFHIMPLHIEVATKPAMPR